MMKYLLISFAALLVVFYLLSKDLAFLILGCTFGILSKLQYIEDKLKK